MNNNRGEDMTRDEIITIASDAEDEDDTRYEVGASNVAENAGDNGTLVNLTNSDDDGLNNSVSGTEEISVLDGREIVDLDKESEEGETLNDDDDLMIVSEQIRENPHVLLNLPGGQTFALSTTATDMPYRSSFELLQELRRTTNPAGQEILTYHNPHSSNRLSINIPQGQGILNDIYRNRDPAYRPSHHRARIPSSRETRARNIRNLRITRQRDRMARFEAQRRERKKAIRVYHRRFIFRPEFLRYYPDSIKQLFYHCADVATFLHEANDTIVQFGFDSQILQDIFIEYKYGLDMGLFEVPITFTGYVNEEFIRLWYEYNYNDMNDLEIHSNSYNLLQMFVNGEHLERNSSSNGRRPYDDDYQFPSIENNGVNTGSLSPSPSGMSFTDISQGLFVNSNGYEYQANEERETQNLIAMIQEREDREHDIRIRKFTKKNEKQQQEINYKANHLPEGYSASFNTDIPVKVIDRKDTNGNNVIMFEEQEIEVDDEFGNKNLESLIEIPVCCLCGVEMGVGIPDSFIGTSKEDKEYDEYAKIVEKYGFVCPYQTLVRPTQIDRDLSKRTFISNCGHTFCARCYHRIQTAKAETKKSKGKKSDCNFKRLSQNRKIAPVILGSLNPDNYGPKVCPADECKYQIRARTKMREAYF